MRHLAGPISDRLRALFGPTEPVWTPTREPAAAVDVPADSYDGWSFGWAGPAPETWPEEEQP